MFPSNFHICFFSALSNQSYSITGIAVVFWTILHWSCGLFVKIRTARLSVFDKQFYSAAELFIKNLRVNLGVYSALTDLFNCIGPLK